MQSKNTGSDPTIRTAHNQLTTAVEKTGETA